MITADTKAALKKMQAKTSLKKNPHSVHVGEGYIRPVWDKQTLTEAKKILTHGQVTEEFAWVQKDGNPAKRDGWGDYEVGTVRKRVNKLRHLGEIDTLVGVGMSGSLIVPKLAAALGIDALVLRKPGVKTHSYEPAEGYLGSRWVFVDDFISSGESMRRAYGLVSEIAVANGIETEFAGAYLYRNDQKLKEVEELVEDYRLDLSAETNIIKEIRDGKRY